MEVAWAVDAVGPEAAVAEEEAVEEGVVVDAVVEVDRRFPTLTKECCWHVVL